jgi:hypothetical protein
LHVYFISWEAQIIKILPIPCKNYYQERNYSSSFLVCQNHDNFWPLSPKGLKPAAVTQLHVRSWLLRWKPWGRVNNDCHPETMHREPWATHSLFIPPPPTRASSLPPTWWFKFRRRKQNHHYQSGRQRKPGGGVNSQYCLEDPCMERTYTFFPTQSRSSRPSIYRLGKPYLISSPSKTH